MVSSPMTFFYLFLYILKNIYYKIYIKTTDIIINLNIRKDNIKQPKNYY